ncbi:MAG: alpha-E domain-containing protein [Marinicaulis sp.]|nr:alpha-E domain-containing protein [Marinicaulis sp.]NNE41541.1 alpha-E domain-containing protein [Marinicaulis sp.]NNL87877.1 alpha-E domain-containing protein [Marinicaulis sp.]
MLLSRFAENAFWLGRYMERVESLARLLWVTESFAADQDHDDAWAPILSVFADSEAFEERGKPLTAVNVARFYLSDTTNANSAVFAGNMAKENARSIRHLISTETWRAVSVFYDELRELQKRRFSLSKLNDICLSIRERSYIHRGVMEATSYRDEVWRFNQLGAALERADQMTRLIDIKYFRFDRDDIDDIAPPDVAWWNTLLRSASGYHAFQRRHPVNTDPADAARFVLCDPYLPLSVTNAAETALYQLERLDKDFDAKPGADIKKAAAALKENLGAPPAKLNGRALHRYLDSLQVDINSLANALNDRYFAPAA